MTKGKKKLGGGGIESPPPPNATDWTFMVTKCIQQYGMIGLVFGIVALGFYYVIRAPGFLQHNLEKYFFLLCLPLLLIFFMILRIEYDEALGPVVVKIAGILLLSGVVAWLYTQSNMSFMFSVIMSWTVIVFIALVALAFLYGYMVGEMRRWKGWLGFAAQLLFYLPCLLRDGWQAVMMELRLTQVSIYLAVLIEVLLIVLYAYLPRITQSVMGTDQGQAIVLQNNPVRLSRWQELTGSAALFDPNNATFRKNYALSMWINLTPFTHQVAGYQTETQVFSYGYESQLDGIHYVKPMIRYYGGGVSTESTEDRDKFVVYASRFPPKNKEEKRALSYDLDMPAQRWNYVVMNYSHNEMTLFVNGELKHTFFLQDAMPQYNELDTITVGDPAQKTGIQGGICNVTYYKHTLTPEQIAFSYNLMKDKDPPLMVIASAAPGPAT
jgi:hypothetical protein